MTRIEWEEDKTAVAALVSSALYLSVGLAFPVVTLITSRGSQARLGTGKAHRTWIRIQVNEAAPAASGTSRS